MLKVSVKKYKKTLENIDKRINDLRHIYSTLCLTKQIAYKIFDENPTNKVEIEYVKQSHDRLLKSVKKGLDKYERIDKRLTRMFELARKNKINIIVTSDKIKFVFDK